MRTEQLAPQLQVPAFPRRRSRTKFPNIEHQSCEQATRASSGRIFSKKTFNILHLDLLFNIFQKCPFFSSPLTSFSIYFKIKFFFYLSWFFNLWMTFLRATWLINITNNLVLDSLISLYFFLNSAMQPSIYYPSSLNNLLLTTRHAKFAWIRWKSLFRIFIHLLNCSNTFSNPWAPSGPGQLLYLYINCPIPSVTLSMFA